MWILRKLSLFAVIGLFWVGGTATVSGQSLVGADAGVATPRPAGWQRGEGQPYEVAGSEVWSVPDPVSGRDYQVFVALPASYAEQPERRYPVLYVTDADYAFPLLRQISRRLNVEGPRVEDFILVGLSYAKGDGGMQSRRRDYTPTPNGPSSAPADAVHGQAAEYITYLQRQVLPFIAGRYRSDEGRRLLLGHSYGGLLGAQVLLTEPTMFAGYVLGSPSFWYDRIAWNASRRPMPTATTTCPPASTCTWGSTRR